MADLGPARFAIGDPGRAALEIKRGRGPIRVGPSDVELSAADRGGVVVQGASVRGTMHRRNGEVRQDAFAFAADADARWIVVVCDGVGSLGRSDEASNLVARRITELVTTETPLVEALAVVNGELKELAACYPPDTPSRDPDADGMATTVIALSVVWRNGCWVGEMCWVGDSDAWHLTGTGEWVKLNVVESRAEETFHSTSVSPLPKAADDYVSTPLCLDGGALFLTSDGVSGPLSGSLDVRNRLAEWWSEPPELMTFGAQVGFPRKGHMDDRTVVGIWAPPSTGTTAASDATATGSRAEAAVSPSAVTPSTG